MSLNEIFDLIYEQKISPPSTRTFSKRSKNNSRTETVDLYLTRDGTFFIPLANITSKMRGRGDLATIDYGHSRDRLKTILTSDTLLLK